MGAEHRLREVWAKLLAVVWPMSHVSKLCPQTVTGNDLDSAVPVRRTANFLQTWPNPRKVSVCVLLNVLFSTSLSQEFSIDLLSVTSSSESGVGKVDQITRMIGFYYEAFLG